MGRRPGSRLQADFFLPSNWLTSGRAARPVGTPVDFRAFRAIPNIQKQIARLADQSKLVNKLPIFSRHFQLGKLYGWIWFN